LSTRTLIQLSEDEKTFPIASEVVRREFYVDDCLSGRSSLAEVVELKHQLISLLKLGKF
jgi:hypothetical protein